MRISVLLAGALILGCHPAESLATKDSDETPPPAAPAVREPEGSNDGGCVGRAGRLDLNDVSFLMPLPSRADGGELLSLSAEGTRGALLPASWRSGLPTPLGSGTEVSDARVIAARVDPCFRSGSGPCRPQLRLVAQPLGERSGEVVTVDATVHLFYELSPADLTAVVGRLRALKQLALSATDCKPLGIHPVMQSEGLGGAYAQALRSLLLDFCGESNLSRVATMQLMRPATVWTFAGFNRSGNAWVADSVPRTSAAVTTQSFSISDTETATAMLAPEPSESSLPLLFKRSKLLAAEGAKVESAVREAYRIENPTRENPGTVDCVSCHLAERGRALAEQARSVTLPDAAERYRGEGFVLSASSKDVGFESQRAFGYFGRDPSITQRTVNESVEVAKQLNLLP